MNQSSYKGRSRPRTTGRKKSNYNNNNSNPGKNSFDSSGPAGKIRGTASYVSEKYVNAAGDAMSNHDFVLAESCFQHADHYLRINLTILAAQQKQEQDRQERQERHDRQRQNNEKSADANIAVADTNVPDKIVVDSIPSAPTESSDKGLIKEVEKPAEKSVEKSVAEEVTVSHVKKEIEAKPAQERKPRRNYTRKKTVISQSENVTVVAAPEIMSV